MNRRILIHLSTVAALVVLGIAVRMSITNRIREPATKQHHLAGPIPYYIDMFPERMTQLPNRAHSLAAGSPQGGDKPIINNFPTPNPSTLPSYAVNTNATAYAFWNYYRQLVGLDVYTINPLLEKSAAAHANYSTINNSYLTELHYETAGKTGFTGIDPCQREAAAGYLDTCMGEEGNADQFAHLNIIGLINAPYHRLGMLSNDFVSAGIGSAGLDSAAKATFFIDLGGYKTSDTTDRRITVFPYPGQPDVPRSWRLSEIPSPLPDVTPGTVVGYPITINSRLKGTLEISDFKLRASDGTIVTGRPVNDRTNTRSALIHSFIFIPFHPLYAASTYSAEAVGSLDGTPVVLSWKFTTQPIQNFTLAASSQTLERNSQTTVRVISKYPFRPNYNYIYFSGTTVTSPEPNTFIISRDGSICTGCYVKIIVQDPNQPDSQQSITIPLAG